MSTILDAIVVIVFIAAIEGLRGRSPLILSLVAGGLLILVRLGLGNRDAAG